MSRHLAIMAARAWLRTVPEGWWYEARVRAFRRVNLRRGSVVLAWLSAPVHFMVIAATAIILKYRSNARGY